MKISLSKNKILEWIRTHKTLSSCVAIYVMMSVMLALDRMLWYSNLSTVNINGWIMYCYMLFPWTLLSLVPLLLAGKYSRWVYVLAVIYMLIINSVEWFVHFKFNMLLDGDLVGIVLGSSPSEMKWFAGNYFVWILFACIAIIGMAWLIIRTSRVACNVKVSKMSIFTAFLFICVFMYAKQMIKLDFGFVQELVCVHLPMDCHESLDSYKRLVSMKESPKIPDAATSTLEYTNGVVGVFILGESSTRSHWSLYGYSRPTTPCLDKRKDELVAFTDLVSLESTTAASMRRIFTTSTYENPTDLRFAMPQVLQKVGIKAALFSNHERWGQFAGDEGFAFAGCDPLLFIKELEGAKFDEALLGYMNKELNCGAANQIVFLHFMGSHTPAYMMYPNGTGPFEAVGGTRSSEFGTPLAINHYDNSIWYTDSLLGKIIEKLETIGKPAFMVYLSDHGETPSSKGWRNVKDRDVWDVPFVVWTSNEFRAEFPQRFEAMKRAEHKSLQSDQLLPGLLHLFGVEGLDFPPQIDFLDERFAPRSPRRIMGGQEVYKW